MSVYACPWWCRADHDRRGAVDPQRPTTTHVLHERQVGAGPHAVCIVAVDDGLPDPGPVAIIGPQVEELTPAAAREVAARLVEAAALHASEQ